MDQSVGYLKRAMWNVIGRLLFYHILPVFLYFLMNIFPLLKPRQVKTFCKVKEGQSCTRSSSYSSVHRAYSYHTLGTISLFFNVWPVIGRQPSVHGADVTWNLIITHVSLSMGASNMCSRGIKSHYLFLCDCSLSLLSVSVSTDLHCN